MDANSRRQKHQNNILSSLNVVIETMNLVKEATSATPAKAVFGSVSIILTMIRVRFSYYPTICSWLTCEQDSMSNQTDYVELGLACADVCEALNRGMNGKKLDDLSQSVRKAINQLTTWAKPTTHGLESSLTTLSISEP